MADGSAAWRGNAGSADENNKRMNGHPTRRR
jgi:hypothetical protein